jgi:small subunit ribosomal protein S2
MKALLETGVHFGHRTKRWNPKMKPFIFTERNGIHIIDLQQTIAALDAAYNLIRDTVANGGTVLFVGTKRQAQDTIAKEAIRAGAPHVTYRWLGGTLTNWRTIRQRIDTLINLEGRRDRGEFDVLPKKEALDLERLITKLNLRLGGIKDMRKLPDALFVIDTHREVTAIKEANTLNIPIIAMVDTNCDPDPSTGHPRQRRRHPRDQMDRGAWLTRCRKACAPQGDHARRSGGSRRHAGGRRQVSE